MIDYGDEEEEEQNPLAHYWMEGDSLAPPCQAELDVVQAILEFAQPTSETVLFDLGCGDGRICIEAAVRYGCNSCGVEIEKRLADKFMEMVRIKDLFEKVTVVNGDLRSVDLRRATVIVIYLLPDAFPQIEEMLVQAMKQGAVIICNTWGPKDWEPMEVRICGPYNNVTLKKYTIASVKSNISLNEQKGSNVDNP